jgi:chromosome segregation ATPase
METYLPLIKTQLNEWYLFTLANPLYAAALAAAVWLLTSMLYSIRIASIKRGKIASEKTAIENLNAVQQQLQHSQEELTATVEQMEKAQSAIQDETQRALTLEQLIHQRNQQISGIIQTLATSFDLGERPILATEDVKAELLWQQHDRVIIQLIERLRTEQQAKTELQKTCQAETTKLAEKDALLKALQTTLDAHTNQFSKLEQALEEQKSILQQQSNAQQDLSNTLKNYRLAETQPAEPEQETIKNVDTWQQPMRSEENPIIEEAAIAQPAQDIYQAEQANEEPQAAVNLQDEETPIELVTTDEAVEPVPSDINPLPTLEEAPSVSEEVPSVASELEQQPVNPPAKGSLGKIKNLFGKKQQPVKTEPKWAATKSDEMLASDAKQQPDDEISGKAKKTPGKLKGFYSKFTSKTK